MWSRRELKDRAKACLRRYYWMAFLASLVVGVLGGGSSSGGGSNFIVGSQSGQYSGYGETSSWVDYGFLLGVLAVMAVVFLIVFVLILIFTVFVGNPMNIGGKRFYMESSAIQRSAGVGTVFYAFGSGNYLNIVKTMFIKDLFIFFWTLLLIVPGIIKSYEYYMVPYILSENPDMNYKDALRLSKEMMDGHKWDTFVLSLSFLGWILLGSLLCGIGVLFVRPYMDAVYAELYGVLRKNTGYKGLKGFGGEEYFDNIVSEQ